MSDAITEIVVDDLGKDLSGWDYLYTSVKVSLLVKLTILTSLHMQLARSERKQFRMGSVHSP